MISSIEEIIEGIRNLRHKTERFRQTPELLLQFILYKLIADQGEALPLKNILAEKSVQAILEKISDEFRRLNQVPAYRDLFVQIIPLQLESDIYDNGRTEGSFSLAQSTSFFSPEIITTDFLKQLDQIDLTEFSPTSWSYLYELIVRDSDLRILLRERARFNHIWRTNHMIVELALMDKKGHELSIYDPNMGLGDLLILAFEKKADEKVKLNGHQEESYANLLIRFNFLAHGIPMNQYEIQFGDPIENDWQNDQDTTTKFDVVISDLSKGKSWSENKELEDDYRFKHYTLPPKSMAEYLYILHGLAHLKDDGVMVVCLPAGALYRIGLEERLRKELIEQHVIDSLIALPARMNQTRGNSVIMILRKQNREKRTGIYMLDVNDQMGYDPRINRRLMQIIDNYRSRQIVPGRSTIASWTAIAANDYNLTILKYVMNQIPQTEKDQIEYQMSAYLREEQKLHEGEMKLRHLMRELDSDKYRQMIHKDKPLIKKTKD